MNLLKIKGYTIEVSQTLKECGKARVLAYVKNNANTTRQTNLENEENEIIVIDHKHQNGITRVQGIYRPFTSTAAISSLPDQERRILKLLNNTGNNILSNGTNIILGDFNVDALSQNHHFSEIMSNFESEFGLDQIIFQITRQRQTNSVTNGQKHEESCLDLVFIDDVGRVLEKDIIFCPESDHSAVMVKLKFNDKHKPYSKTIWSRDYTKFEQSKALADCMMVDWAEMCMQQPSLDDNYDALVNKLMEIHEIHCPKKKLVFTEKRSLGSHVLSNLEKRQKNLYRKMKKRRSQDDILQYKNHLKKMKREREKLRRNQISKILKKRSCKDIWSLYNKMTGKSKEDGDLCLNTESGNITNDPKQCADQFAKAFHAKVDRLRSQSTPKHKPSINIDTIPRPTLDVPMKFTTQEIRNEIYSAKNSRSSGTDGIDAIFLKQVICEEILIGLRFIFEKCAALGRSPAQWKMSKIVPLFKKGDPLNAENYRPIANLNHLGKIYEKLILKRVWAMMGDSLPSNHQHGFRPQHSTETATTSIFALINKLFERKKKVILVTLDMSAAFDLLDKSILIPKLRAHGFPERIIAIYKDFLSGRRAVVQVGESVSEPFDQEVGCVQGSPSGPLLFSLLVNNISEALTMGKIVCYADDSYLIFEGDSWDEVCKIASEETTNVVNWLQNIGMVVNSSKTEAIYFSKHEQNGLEMEVASSKIEVGTTMRVLGVMFDSKLSWENHIVHVCNIVKKKIYALRRISSDLNQAELLNIAHGSIYSVLYYAAGTWLNEGLKEKFVRRLKVLSNSTLQIVFGKRRQECSTLELHSLANMLTPKQMVLYQPACLLQKVLAVKAPGDLYTLAMSQVSYKERTNTTMVTKNWTSKVGLSRFPNNAHETLLLIKGDISKEKTTTFKKNMHAVITSQST